MPMPTSPSHLARPYPSRALFICPFYIACTLKRVSSVTRLLSVLHRYSLIPAPITQALTNPRREKCRLPAILMCLNGPQPGTVTAGGKRGGRCDSVTQHTRRGTQRANSAPVLFFPISAAPCPSLAQRFPASTQPCPAHPPLSPAPTGLCPFSIPCPASSFSSSRTLRTPCPTLPLLQPPPPVQPRTAAPAGRELPKVPPGRAGLGLPAAAPPSPELRRAHQDEGAPHRLRDALPQLGRRARLTEPLGELPHFRHGDMVRADRSEPRVLPPSLPAGGRGGAGRSRWAGTGRALVGPPRPPARPRFVPAAAAAPCAALSRTPVLLRTQRPGWGSAGARSRPRALPDRACAGEALPGPTRAAGAAPLVELQGRNKGRPVPGLTRRQPTSR